MNQIRTQNNAGISLLEVVVAVGIFALVIGSIVAILLTAFRSKDVIFEQLLVQSQARKAMQDFVDEIRSANYSGVGAYPLMEASSSEIVFYTNIDADSVIEKVRYFLSGRTLFKGVVDPPTNPPDYFATPETTSTVANSISSGGSPLFYYYDQSFDGTKVPLTQPVDVTKVRVVEIKFQLEKDVNVAPTALPVQARAAIRNLKGN